MYKISKRMIDILASSVGFTVTSPIMITIAVFIKINMGSPVLFRQQRPGIYGKPFILYKFRTMRLLKEGESLIGSDQDRITKLGKFLRATSLDELPTLLNVLNGDMSLVGPRPLLMQYLDRYTSKQMRRHEVKPGITGWAQVNGRNAISWEDKFEYDVWYVDNQSLSIDVKILLKTLLQVIKREGINHPEAVTMPEFKGEKNS